MAKNSLSPLKGGLIRVSREVFLQIMQEATLEKENLRRLLDIFDGVQTLQQPMTLDSEPMTPVSEESVDYNNNQNKRKQPVPDDEALPNSINALLRNSPIDTTEEGASLDLDKELANCFKGLLRVYYTEAAKEILTYYSDKDEELLCDLLVLLTDSYRRDLEGFHYVDENESSAPERSFDTLPVNNLESDDTESDHEDWNSINANLNLPYTLAADENDSERANVADVHTDSSRSENAPNVSLDGAAIENEALHPNSINGLLRNYFTESAGVPLPPNCDTDQELQNTLVCLLDLFYMGVANEIVATSSDEDEDLMSGFLWLLSISYTRDLQLLMLSFENGIQECTKVPPESLGSKINLDSYLEDEDWNSINADLNILYMGAADENENGGAKCTRVRTPTHSEPTSSIHFHNRTVLSSFNSFGNNCAIPGWLRW